MDNLITLDDFKGRFVLQVGQFREEQFNDYISQKQDELLKRFLSADLYADLKPIPKFKNGLILSAVLLI